MDIKRYAATTFVLISMCSSLALAQPLTAEWSSVAKIANGNCGDGSTASITEKAGSLHLKLVYPNGKQYAEFDVALGADGSGKAQFKGNAGADVLLEVPAGKGKRPMKTTEVRGVCQWNWTPK